MSTCCVPGLIQSMGELRPPSSEVCCCARLSPPLAGLDFLALRVTCHPEHLSLSLFRRHLGC